MRGTTAKKIKLSVSLSGDLLARIDEEAALTRTTRSGVMERWLSELARSKARHEIEQATADYYEALTREERAEELAIARAASRATRKLVIDDAPPRRGATRRAT